MSEKYHDKAEFQELVEQKLISEFVNDLNKILDKDLWDGDPNGAHIVDIIEKWEKKLK